MMTQEEIDKIYLEEEVAKLRAALKAVRDGPPYTLYRPRYLFSTGSLKKFINFVLFGRDEE